MIEARVSPELPGEPTQGLRESERGAIQCDFLRIVADVSIVVALPRICEIAHAVLEDLNPFRATLSRCPRRIRRGRS
jgi:hypothetical protein